MLRRTGLLDDVMDVAARLPWGVTVVLATVIHALLHILAVDQDDPPLKSMREFAPQPRVKVPAPTARR